MIPSTKLAGRRLLRLGSASLSAAPGQAPRIRTRRYAAADGVAASSTTTTTTTTTTTAAASGGENGEGGPLGKAFFSSLCLLTFGLGTWQTRRYFEKVEMVKKREDDLGMDPLPNFDMWRTTRGNDDDEDAAVDMKTKTKTKIADVPRSYRRVRLRGEFQHANEMLIGPRGPPPGALAESGPNSGRGGGGGMSSSAQGYLVVTPFVISDDDDDDDDDNGDNGDDAVRRRRTTTGIRGEEGGAGRIIRGWFGRLQRGEEAGESYDSKSKAVRSPSSIDANEVGTVVWINRGWIPRHYVNNRYEIVTSWERPRGTVTLTAMESNTETGGTFAPPSRLEGGRRGNGGDDRRPTPECKRLLWMDRRAMEELTSCGADRHPYLFVEIDAVERKGAPPSFPAKASREFVGEFKVSPGVHAGYAFTWFGLSSAGIVMTRKLLSRGR